MESGDGMGMGWDGDGRHNQPGVGWEPWRKMGMGGMGGMGDELRAGWADRWMQEDPMQDKGTRADGALQGG